jgi:hypothetical protein
MTGRLLLPPLPAMPLSALALMIMTLGNDEEIPHKHAAPVFHHVTYIGLLFAIERARSIRFHPHE